MLNIKRFIFNYFQENCYIVWDDTRMGVIVDPGCMGDHELRQLLMCITENGIVPKTILLTHGHFDHIYGVPALASILGADVWMNPADEELVATENASITAQYGIPSAASAFEYKPVKEGDTIKAGNMEFRVIATPGHTAGGVCYYCEKEKLLLTGDNLFAGTIGRTDGKWGDYDKLIIGIMDKLMGLDGDVEVLPGHGPTSNIGYERTHNPFLQPFNEPEEDFDNDLQA
mgnify:CR=1 FL=1